MEFYERYSATSKMFTYVQQIENFSVRLYNGSSVTSTREHAGCEWIFTLNGREDALDATLSREHWRGRSFVKTKVFLVDCFGRSSLHAEKNVRFERDTENVLHLTKDYLLNGNCGLNQLLYVPGDTLTVKWEVTTYEYSEKAYDSRKEFENSSRIPPGSVVFSWPVAKFLLKFLALCCLFVSILAVTVMFVVSVYTFFQTVVIPYFAAVAKAVDEFLSLFFGFVAVFLFTYALKVVSSPQSGLNRRTNNNDRMRLTQVERRQIALPSNRGVARYETVRSMTYGNFQPIRYNNRYNY